MAADWSRPLDGLKVLDLSDGIAAGFTTRLFAQLGAEVSRPRHNTDDSAREVAHGSQDLKRRVGGFLHAGKTTVPIAKKAFHPIDVASLAESSDIVVQDRGEAFASELLCLPTSTAKVVSLSSYGWTGPCKSWAADSLLLQSSSGIATLVGSPDREPLMLPGFAVQYSAGALAFIAGMALVLGNDAEERHVLVTEVESASTLHQLTYLAYTRLGWVRKRGQFMLPTATYMPCQDGEIVIAAVKPNHWTALAIICDCPELLERPSYRTFLERRLHAKEIESELRPWFAKRSCAEAFEQLCSVGVPAAVIQTPVEASRDPQFAHRGFAPGSGEVETGLPVPFLLNGIRPNRVPR